MLFFDNTVAAVLKSFLFCFINNNKNTLFTSPLKKKERKRKERVEKRETKRENEEGRKKGGKIKLKITENVRNSHSQQEEIVKQGEQRTNQE